VVIPVAIFDEVKRIYHILVVDLLRHRYPIIHSEGKGREGK